MGNRDPGTTLLAVDQWIKSHVVPDKQQLLTRPTTKRELNDIFKTSISNAEQLYRTTGELFYHLQLSIEALSKLLKENADLKQRIDHSSIFEDLKSNLESSIAKKFEELSDKIDRRLQSEIEQAIQPSYAEKASTDHYLTSNSQVPKNMLHNKPAEVAVITTESVLDDETAADFGKKVTENLKDVQLQFMSIKKGSRKILLGFPNQDELSKGIAANKDLTTDNHCTIKTAEKLLPKLTVQNVNSNIFNGLDMDSADEEQRNLRKSRIIELIKMKNPAVKKLVDDGHTLKVVYMNASVNGRNYTIAIKVSPSIRSALLNGQGGRLFIGNEAYPFSDRFHFEVCYHCQGIGHLSKNCPHAQEPATCLYCSGQHRSSQCPNKKDSSKFNCAKCSRSNISKFADNSYTHNAASLNCPLYIREVQRLQNITDFTSKNVM